MSDAVDDSTRWRRNILWALGLLAAVVIVTFSYGLAEYFVLDRIAPHFPHYTDEDTARIFGPLYGYDSDITQYAAHPLAVAINSTIDAMRDDVETRSKALLDDVYSVMETILIFLAGVFAILAIRSSDSSKRRYIALMLTVLSGVALVVWIATTLSKVL
ncbi:hypothetical protein HYW59_03255 [Candidatus Kaiserbacteria bacterium]|nr:hypothetical protein [Candidatus Kaiserbacteria bacterium]